MLDWLRKTDWPRRAHIQRESDPLAEIHVGESTARWTEARRTARRRSAPLECFEGERRRQRSSALD